MKSSEQILRLRKKLNQYKIIITTMLVYVLYWIIESFMDTYVFQFDPSLVRNFFFLSVHEIWMRFLIFSFFIFIGIFAQIIIGKRKKAEDIALKERKRAELYLDLAGVIIVALNIEGEIILLNKKGYQVLGFDYGELIGKHWFKMCLPEDIREDTYNEFKRLIAGELEPIEYYENKIVNKDGKKKIIAWHNALLFNEQGMVVGTLSSGEDITERKKAEKGLKKSENRYRSLFDNMLDGFAFCKIITDEDNNPVDFLYLEVNDAFEKLTGLKKEDTIGHKVTEIIPDIKNSEPNLFEIYGKVALTGENTRFELYFEPLKIWLTISVYSPKRGYFVAVFDNITERKIAEEVIENEIKKLKELDQIKNDLTRRVSHELKTPLISIYSAANLLLDVYRDELSSRSLKIIEMIKDGGERLRGLANSLVDIYDLESNKIKLDLKMSNITEILEICIKKLQPLIIKRQHELDMDISQEVYLKVDDNRIKQAIINLLGNAIKYTPPKGKIYVKLHEFDKRVEIIIKDIGVGFTEQEKGKIFKKFGKIERHGNGMFVDTEGPGLGLYISREIVRLHDGDISLKSEGRNKGSIFLIQIPKKNQN